MYKIISLTERLPVIKPIVLGLNTEKANTIISTIRSIFCKKNSPKKQLLNPRELAVNTLTKLRTYKNPSQRFHFFQIQGLRSFS